MADEPTRPSVWEINPDYPSGHARPMTDEEVALYQADKEAAAAAAAEPRPLSPAEQLVQIFTSAADFDTAKADMAAWLTNQQEPAADSPTT